MTWTRRDLRVDATRACQQQVRRSSWSARAAVRPADYEELRRSYPAHPETVPVARRDVCEFAARHGATDEQLDEVRLLVSEAVTNAIRHAYPDRAGTLEVTAALSAGLLTILVSDDGVGPRTASRDPGSGWGWPLIAALTEQFAIRHRGGSGGTEVEMGNRIGPHRGAARQARRRSDSSTSTPPTPPL